MPPHPLTDFQIQAFYLNKPRFKSVDSRNNFTILIALELNIFQKKLKK